MSTLLDRRTRNTPGDSPRPPATAGMPAMTGVLVALQAAAASLSVVLVPVVLAWATASFSSAPWGQAVQLGVGTWLLAHHAGIVIPGGHVGLVPLGLTAIPLVCCWLAGVRLARNLDPNAASLRAGVGRARPVLPPPRAIVCLVASYSGLVTVASLLATSASVRPLAAQAFVGAVVISSVGSVWGAAAWAAGGVLPGLRLVLRRCRLPSWMTRILPAVATSVAVQLAGGLLVLLLALVLGWDRVLLLHHALGPGIAGGLVLILGQLTVVPNLVIWAVSVTAGPGFMVGTGTSVDAGSTVLGAVPAVPVLGALPAPGPHPAWVWGLMALPALSGLVLGVLLVRRDRSAGPLAVLADTGRAALVTGVLWALLGWLSGGPAGPGRLADLGPVSWQLGLAMMAEAGAGAVVSAMLMLLIGHLLAPPSAPETEDRARLST